MTEETLFAAALDRADPADRAAFLAAHCPDPAARRRLEELLAAHAAAGSFLNRPAVGADVTTAFPPADPDVTHTQVSTDPDATADPRAPRPADADADEALAFLKPSPRPGALGRLDHYDVLEVVGSGGFGTVMKAFDARLHRVVAVKVLAPQLAASGAARARFHREARTAAAVKDDHVVNVHAVTDDDAPVPYLVMEFIAGQTVQQKLDRAGPLPPREVLRVGLQAAKGLAAAHAQGLIHRDIKPANILLENGVERVKITDFGLARAADDASLSQSGAVAGTPMYMSPEQARGDALDTRSDLFSLGSVLYALCTGRPPFRADTTLAVLKRVVEDDPRPVREVNPEVPRWLADVVAKLHAKAPADRFQTATEVADLLAGYLAELQQQGTVAARRGVAPRRTRAATGWAWWFAVPLVLSALLSAAAVLPEPNPPDDLPRREALFSLGYGFGFVAGVGLVATALVSALSRRWAVRFGALTAAAAVAAAATGALGLVTPERAEAPPPAVVTVRLSDPAIRVRFDSVGFVGSEVTQPQYLVAPGGHAVWFALGGREFRTAAFALGPGERVVLELAVTAAGGTAALDGRPLAVTPLTAGADGFIPLFNGRDLTGWKTHPDAPGRWAVESGVLTGRGQGFLFTERGDYANFHLRLRARVNADGDSSIPFRTPFELFKVGPNFEHFGITGYLTYLHPANREGQNRPTASVARTGGPGAGYPDVLCVVPGNLIRAGEWFEFELIADGSRFVTKVNGKEVANCGDPLSKYDRGHVALCAFSAGTVVEYRTIEVKNLSPPPAVAPFTPEQARAHQEAWAAHLGVPVEFENHAGLTFRLIPPGEFGMGFTDAELAAVRAELKGLPHVGPFERFAAESSGPRHTVRVTRPFYLAGYETTAAQFRRFVDATRHRPTGATDWATFVAPGQEERQPAVGVSWADADAFCRWLGAGYELPTEAQWEYAARAGGAGLWSFGDDPKALVDHAAVGLATRAPGPVGLKAANPFGLFDVYGGATEWCRDWHVADYYRRAPIDDPVNLDPPTDPATGRAARGGSWNAPGLYARAAFRAFDNPTAPAMPKGFRVALGGDLKAAVEAAKAAPAARRAVVAAAEKARELDRTRVAAGTLSPHRLHLADHAVAAARAELAAATGDPAGAAAALREAFVAACRYRDFEFVRVSEGLDRAEYDRAEGLVAEARVRLARAGVAEPPPPPQPAPPPRPRG